MTKNPRGIISIAVGKDLELWLETFAKENDVGRSYVARRLIEWLQEQDDASTLIGGRISNTLKRKA